MTEITPVPAATVALVRDAPGGMEVLLLQRNFQSGFVAGMYLFPGGALDPEDDSDDLRALAAGVDDAAASTALGVTRGGLAYWAAAIREAFEEAGVLLAYTGEGLFVDPGQGRYAEHRRRLVAGEPHFIAMLKAERLRLAADRLVYFGHWITPVSLPRRYDTRFFVGRAPERQAVTADNVETIGHVWIAPAQALDRHRKGEFKMRTPTVFTLEQFAAYDSAAALLEAMQVQRPIPAILPRITRGGARLLPGDPGYDAPVAWKTR
jgi:8-oxo-dGTP pyrophosphatase MutT (NUDIX family)